MTSTTYLVEVRDDGMIAIGRLDHVTRTVRTELTDYNATPETWITLNGRILTTEIRDADEARITALTAMITAAGA